MVDYFKNLFSRLVKFIKNKMFGKEKEREDYWKVSKDMYEHGIFSDDTIESIKDDYVWNKENDKHKETTTVITNLNIFFHNVSSLDILRITCNRLL